MAFRVASFSLLLSIATISTAQIPPARGHFALAYDGASQKVVLAGGAAFFGQKMALYDDYWAWDGKAWKRMGNTSLPIMGARMVYDAAHKRMLLLGGSGGRAPQVGELRALVGMQWTVLGSATELKGVDPGFAIDTQRSRVVAFIPGADGATAKTYEWDGRYWRPGKGQGPVDHEGVSMVYDVKRAVTVAFGGHGVSKKPYDDVWEYDGLHWKQIVANGPSARSYPGMAYDDKLGAVVIHGGMSADAKWLSDTWSWDGAAWKQLSAKGPALESAMAYDAARDRLVVVGTDSHENNSGGMQTWEWDGAAWTKLSG